MLLLVFAVGTAGSFVTAPQIPGWYAQLRKPVFNPPDWIFAPVWTCLYITMAVAAWRVWLTPASPQRRQALVLFFVQLAFNALWSQVFFGFQAPRPALAVIIALLLTLALTTREFLASDRIAGWLMLPYLGWVAFATLLNGAIAALN